MIKSEIGVRVLLRWSAVFLLFLQGLPLISETIQPEKIKILDAALFLTLDSSAQIVQFQVSQLETEALRQPLILQNLPAPDYQSTLQLHLWPHRSVVAPDLTIQIVTPQGTTAFIPPPRLTVLAGTIIGEPHSDVLLMIIDSTLFGFIRSSQWGDWILQPFSSRPDYLTYTPMKLDPAQSSINFICYDPPTAETESSTLLDPASLLQVDFSDLLIAKLAIECDSDLYRAMGKDTIRATRYVLALLQAVSRLYEREVNVAFEISWLRIWTEGQGEDPYTARSVPQLLQQLTQYWRTHHMDVERAITHLLTIAPNMQSGVGGIAWRDHLCDPQQNFSVSSISGTVRFPKPDYAWDIMVVAHEIGHNIRARHTHDCWWNPPLDTCVTQDGPIPVGDACFRSPIQPRPSEGSIMSYCHLINSNGVRMWFSPKVAAVLRQAILEQQYNNRCITRPSGPIVHLTDPVGNQTFAQTEPLSIRWTAANTAAVRLWYAYAGDTQWHLIAQQPADQREYQWILPEDFPDTTIYLRITASVMPSIADTAGPIAIRRPLIVWTSLLDSAELPIGTPYQLLWRSQLLDTVTIEFSADSQRTWQPIAEHIPSTGYYRWTIPNLPTDKGFLRIFSPQTPTIGDTNRYAFRIGTPYLKLLAPRLQDTWIAGTEDTIRWDAGFLNFISIWLSTDDGNQWKRIKFAVPARQSLFIVRVPNTPTTTARIKLQGDTLEAISDRFVIQSNPTSVGQYSESTVLLQWPATGRSLTLPIPSPGTYQLSLWTLVGQCIEQQSITIPSTASPVLLDIAPLPSGLYILQLQRSDQWYYRSAVIIP